MIWLLAYLAACAAGALVLFWIASHAPEGWESEEHGFQYGKEPEAGGEA